MVTTNSNALDSHISKGLKEPSSDLMERLEIYIFSTIKNISQMEDGLDVVFLEIRKQLFFKER
jgi:hypothetical protein